MRIISYNVNGVRSALQKGLLTWLKAEKPDVVCLQEIRAQRHQLPSDLFPLCGYHTYWNFSAKPGYSGTAILARTKPLSIHLGFEGAQEDGEARVIIARFPNIQVVNLYVPNGNRNEERLQYKLDFYSTLLEKSSAFANDRVPSIICGDFNVAHQDIDVSKPELKRGVSGLLPAERQWIDRLLDLGFVDSYRHLYPEEKDAYSWWPASPGGRHWDRGWRFDYIFVQRSFSDAIAAANLHKEIQLSDHCPIGITLRDFSADGRTS